MRKTVSPEASEKLFDILFAQDTHEEVEVLHQKIVEWYESQNTFSDWVRSDEGQWQKYCPTCERRYTARPLAFPKLMVRYLHLLVHFGKPMTIKEISAESGIPRQFDESSHFPLLRHWGLIERKERAKYIATPLARRVLAMEEKIPCWIWVFEDSRLETPPPGESDGGMAYISEIPVKGYDDAEILNASVSAFAIDRNAIS